MVTLATSSKPKRHLLGMLVVASVALVLGVWFGLHRDTGRSIATIAATVLSPAKPLAEFSLVDQHGRPFNKASLTGKWTFMFFGYTNCPDVCPTTLQVLEKIDAELAASAGNGRPRQVVFVSVDPERDTPAALGKYVAYFDPGFIGVTGSASDVEALTRQLGILHMRTMDQPDSGYLVEHSASLLLLDPDAALRAIFSAPHQPQSIARDFLEIAAADS